MTFDGVLWTASGSNKRHQACWLRTIRPAIQFMVAGVAARRISLRSRSNRRSVSRLRTNTGRTGFEVYERSEVQWNETLDTA